LKVPNKNNLTKRSLSRLIAVQSLYQYDFYTRKNDINALAKQLVENYCLSETQEKSVSYQDKIDAELLESLVSGVVLVLEPIDEEIKAFLKNEWKIDNLPDVILAILRLATFELKYLEDVPTKVVINEYVDLAACFYEDKKVTFVNKILQNIADKTRVEK
jgi:N utilization substance protein B